MEIGGGISIGGGINYEADTTPIYSFKTIPTSINEGQSGSFVVNTVYVANNTTLYWTILNTSTSNLDFPSPFSGSFTITNGIGSFTVIPETDNTTEGSQTFSVQIRTISTSGDVVATSNLVTVNDTSLTSLPSAITAELLIVGGGGGGGSCGSNGSGGGGGAGGLFYNASVAISPSTTYTITVGGGGSGDPGGYGNTNSPNPANPGIASSAFGKTALGGGRGGSPGTTANGYGTSGTALNGGSGGGAGGSAGKAGSGLQPSSASGGYGNGGGTGVIGGGSGTQAGQGGGGAGAAGTAGGSTVGVGGAGRSYSISGTATYYAGGGSAGGTNTDTTGGAATLGGGGAGGNRLNNGGNATYYGGGGGGAGSNFSSLARPGGSGYQGIVIIRYTDSQAAATSTTGNPVITASGGYRVYTFTASGSITF